MKSDLTLLNYYVFRNVTWKTAGTLWSKSSNEIIIFIITITELVDTAHSLHFCNAISLRNIRNRTRVPQVLYTDGVVFGLTLLHNTRMKRARQTEIIVIVYVAEMRVKRRQSDGRSGHEPAGDNAIWWHRRAVTAVLLRPAGHWPDRQCATDVTRGMQQSRPSFDQCRLVVGTDVCLSVCLSVRVLVNVRACFASPRAHPLRTDVGLRQLRPSVGIATIHPAAAASEADAADADRQCVYRANLNDSAASYHSYCIRCCLGKSATTFEPT